MDAAIDFLDTVIDLLGPFGTVSVLPIPAGHGIHIDGMLLAIVIGDTMWMKTDAMNQVDFEAVGARALPAEERRVDLPGGFHSAPDAALQSATAMLPWARSAYDAALRSGHRVLSARGH